MAGWGKYGVDWSSYDTLRLSPLSAAIAEITEAYNERITLAVGRSSATRIGDLKLWPLRDAINKIAYGLDLYSYGVSIGGYVSARAYIPSDIDITGFTVADMRGFFEFGTPVEFNLNWHVKASLSGIPSGYYPQSPGNLTVDRLSDAAMWIWSIYTYINELCVVAQSYPFAPIYRKYNYSYYDSNTMISNFLANGLSSTTSEVYIPSYVISYGSSRDTIDLQNCNIIGATAGKKCNTKVFLGGYAKSPNIYESIMGLANNQIGIIAAKNGVVDIADYVGVPDSELSPVGRELSVAYGQKRGFGVDGSFFAQTQDYRVIGGLEYWR